MNMNDNKIFTFRAKIVRDPDTNKPTRVVDRELLLKDVREYVRPLSMVSAIPTVAVGPKPLPFDPEQSRYIHWDSESKQRALSGAASLFPKTIRVVSADDANLIHFNRHPEFGTFIHLARGAELVVLDLVTTLRRDLAEWYNQAAFESLAGAIVRRGGAVWIVGTETPSQFRQTFSDVYRVLRRLGARNSIVGDNDSESGDDDAGDSHDDA